MQLGVCTDFENITLAAKAGFDYIECAINALAVMPEDTFQHLLMQDFPIPILRGNCLLPGQIKVCGNDANEASWREYLEKAFSRARVIGVETVIFGSGNARMVPEGFSFAQAWQQIIRFLRVAAEIAEKYSLKLAIEPLRREECNIVNYVSEGTLLSAIVNCECIGVLGDTFHMLTSNEPYQALAYAGEKLYHIHTSRPLEHLIGRAYPFPDDGADYESLIAVLRSMHYRGAISIEASTNDFAHDAPLAVARLKKLLQFENP